MGPGAREAGARNKEADRGPSGLAAACTGDHTMSFELRSAGPLRKEARRIVRKQLENALEGLTGEHEGPRDEVVHETRKCFKKVRALLRLVRPVIGEKAYRAENLCFRDVARPL